MQVHFKEIQLEIDLRFCWAMSHVTQCSTLWKDRALQAVTN